MVGFNWRRSHSSCTQSVVAEQSRCRCTQSWTSTLWAVWEGRAEIVLKFLVGQAVSCPFTALIVCLCIVCLPDAQSSTWAVAASSVWVITKYFIFLFLKESKQKCRLLSFALSEALTWWSWWVCSVIPLSTHLSLPLKHEDFNAVAASKVKCHLAHYHDLCWVHAIYEFKC